MFNHNCGKCDPPLNIKTPPVIHPNTDAAQESKVAYGLSPIFPHLKKERLRGKGPQNLPKLWHWTCVVFSPQGRTLTGGLFRQPVSGAVIQGHGHESTPRQDQMRWGDAKDWQRGKERKGQTSRKGIFPCEHTHNGFPALRACIYPPCVFAACLDSFRFA